MKEGLTFASDPLAYMAEKAHDAAQSLAETVLPALNASLTPDLTADWFLEAYRVTFALAILIWVGQLMWTLLQVGRNVLPASELAETLFPRTMLFLGGAMFGPAVGGFLLRGFGALTDDILKMAVGGTSADIQKRMDGMFNLPGALPGGDLVALLIYTLMIIGLLMCVIVMAVMYVTLYLTGIGFPLMLQFLANPAHRDRAWMIVRIWVGVLLAHPLMFLLLGVALQLATSKLLPTGSDGASGLGILTGLLVAVVALWMAVLSPMALMKFVPMADDMGEGPSASNLARRSMPSLPRLGGGGGGAGGSSMASGASTDSGDADAGAEGGGGGQDLIAAAGTGGGSSSAATGSAAAGAEAGAEAGAATGPGALVTAAAGAAMGAAAGAVDDGMSEAGSAMDDAGASGADGGGQDLADSEGSSSGGSALANDAASPSAGASPSASTGGGSTFGGSTGGSASTGSEFGGGGGSSLALDDDASSSIQFPDEFKEEDWT